MEAEERETGVVSGKIYWLYLMAGGGTLMIFMYFLLFFFPKKEKTLFFNFFLNKNRLIFSYVIGEIVRVSSDLWLALWSTPADERSFKFDPPPFGGDTENFFMYIYILFSLVYSGFTLFRNSTFFFFFFFLSFPFFFSQKKKKNDDLIFFYYY